jgi:hypothetical protein
MNKTEYFNEHGGLGSVNAYRKFIKEKQNIDIISVNVIHNNVILLTYKEHEKGDN